jgi:uncharacterized membrane protein YfcA
MMVGIVIGTVSGAGLIAGARSTAALAALGVALTLYAALGLRSKKFVVRPTHELWLSPLIGVVTGLITGATGIFVIPAVPYLQALQLERKDLIQVLGLSFTVSTVALGGGLFRQGVFEASTSLLGLSLLALVPALLGTFAGQHLRERMSVETFRRVFFIGLLLLRLYLTLKGLS